MSNVNRRILEVESLLYNLFNFESKLYTVLKASSSSRACLS